MTSVVFDNATRENNARNYFTIFKYFMYKKPIDNTWIYKNNTHVVIFD